jgi:very-short-patch-repair endonuclease
MRPPRPWMLPTQPVTRALLLASGVTPAMIESQRRAGRLMTVRHGVYLSANSWPDDPAGRHLVLGHAEQVANPGAVLSHQSAAASWGLPTPGFQEWHDLGVCVTLPPGAGHGSQHRSAQHRVMELPAEQVTRDAEGYEVTSIPRTAIDLAAGRPLPDSLVILDAAARLLVGHYLNKPRRSDYANPRLARAAREQLDAAAIGRRPDQARSIGVSDPLRESAAESLSAGHFLLAGLPVPQYQARVTTRGGTFYPDFLWPELRVIGEVDGAIKYQDANAFVLEKQREQILRDLGYIIVRWLAREIMLTPWVVIERVERALSL